MTESAVVLVNIIAIVIIIAGASFNPSPSSSVASRSRMMVSMMLDNYTGACARARACALAHRANVHPSTLDPMTIDVAP